MNILTTTALVGAPGCGCGQDGPSVDADDRALEPLVGSPAVATAETPTAPSAEQFVAEAERDLELRDLVHQRIFWLEATNRTQDTEALSTWANEEAAKHDIELARRAARFAAPEDPVVRRKLDFLRRGSMFPSPSDPDKLEEKATLATRLESTYSAFAHCRDIPQCRKKEELYETLRTSRQPQELAEAWSQWHRLGPALRGDYTRYIELMGEGARELGYDDVGALWHSRYDMSAEEFEADLVRQWNQIEPLYRALHCHTRAKLRDKYGATLVPEGEPIPAHLLGDMWAQYWNRISDLMGLPGATPDAALAAAFARRKDDARTMVRYAEGFFTSLGFEPLPETFWSRSLLVKPVDREVDCHASAWSIDARDDVRMKMCVDATPEDFRTLHHELGHIYYYLAYKGQPPLFRGGAHDGFHEAVGDTIILSITPEYLHNIGLLDESPGQGNDLALLMERALQGLPRIAVELVVTRWQIEAMSGKIPSDRFNERWWSLRREIQGVVPPGPRTEAAFDAGVFYHVANNIPYTRYFLASTLQYALHKSLCSAAGYEGPLHRCSIYQSAEAGAKLKMMLSAGASRPFQDTLALVTGAPRVDASAIVEYFAPLKAWLDEQNKDRQCGW